MSLINQYPALCQRRDASRKNALHYGCLHPDISPDIISTFISFFPDVCKDRDDKGRVPLHYASELNQSTPIISSLLRIYPVACRIRDSNGHLPIHCALANLQSLSSEALSLLLDEYPDSIKYINEDGDTLLHFVCRPCVIREDFALHREVSRGLYDQE